MNTRLYWISKIRPACRGGYRNSAVSAALLLQKVFRLYRSTRAVRRTACIVPYARSAIRNTAVWANTGEERLPARLWRCVRSAEKSTENWANIREAQLPVRSRLYARSAGKRTVFWLITATVRPGPRIGILPVRPREVSRITALRRDVRRRREIRQFRPWVIPEAQLPVRSGLCAAAAAPSTGILEGTITVPPGPRTWLLPVRLRGASPITVPRRGVRRRREIRRSRPWVTQAAQLPARSGPCAAAAAPSTEILADTNTAPRGPRIGIPPVQLREASPDTVLRRGVRQRREAGRLLP